MIESSQTVSQERLTGMDIINVPYPSSHDYRNALNYIPTVFVDPYAQVHVAGSQTYQTVTVLDGLNVTQPSNGQLLLHVSTDAFRSIRVEASRYSAEFGKGSGGVILLETGIGDDHYRFIATDFIPSWQNKKGWKFDQFNPRLTLSGPIVKGKIWFFDALDGVYQNLIVTELPDDQNQDVVTRLGNLAKVQANLSSRNILTTSFNLNEYHDQHAGLSPQNPQASTPAVGQPAYQGGMKDQHYFAGGTFCSKWPSVSIATISTRFRGASIRTSFRRKPRAAATISPRTRGRTAGRSSPISTCALASGMAVTTLKSALIWTGCATTPTTCAIRSRICAKGKTQGDCLVAAAALALLPLFSLSRDARSYPVQH